MLAFTVHYIKVCFYSTNGNVEMMKKASISLAFKLLDDILTYPYGIDDISSEEFELYLEDIFHLNFSVE